MKMHRHQSPSAQVVDNAPAPRQNVSLFIAVAHRIRVVDDQDPQSRARCESTLARLLSGVKKGRARGSQYDQYRSSDRKQYQLLNCEHVRLLLNGLKQQSHRRPGNGLFVVDD